MMNTPALILHLNPQSGYNVGQKLIDYIHGLYM
jgi:hypothetical protein